MEKKKFAYDVEIGTIMDYVEDHFMLVIKDETWSDEEIELMVIEQTMINNVNYLLVTDSEEDEADAYILKETGAETEEAYYEFVEDSTELEVISKVFEQMLDDIDLKYE